MAGAERESACAAPQARDNVGTDYNKRTSLPNPNGNPSSAIEAPFAHYASPVMLMLTAGHTQFVRPSIGAWAALRARQRTPLGQLERVDEAASHDHHPNCFSIWMAGSGIKGSVQQWHLGAELCTLSA